jgi:hypothetical protein
LSAVIGGLGALIGDLFIFNVKFSFKDEFLILERTLVLKEVNYLIKTTLGKKIKMYLLYVFAGIIIASPLPDESGILMLAGLSHIKLKVLALISFIFNTLGILIMLLL